MRHYQHAIASGVAAALLSARAYSAQTLDAHDLARRVSQVMKHRRDAETCELDQDIDVTRAGTIVKGHLLSRTTTRGGKSETQLLRAWKNGAELSDREMKHMRADGFEGLAKMLHPFDEDMVQDAPPGTFELMKDEELWGHPTHVLKFHFAGPMMAVHGTASIDANSGVVLRQILEFDKVPTVALDEGAGTIRARRSRLRRVDVSPDRGRRSSSVQAFSLHRNDQAKLSRTVGAPVLARAARR
jgi:hypothetical protein